MLPEIDLVIRLGLALGIGALIGYQREMDDEPAGFRTHILICVGSALFTILSFEFVGNVDPSRVAAGLVTGIGFLGAGAIFKAENRIKGLTTAADLWVLAAIGMAVGIGYYLAVILTGVIVFIILYLKKVTMGKT